MNDAFPVMEACKFHFLPMGRELSFGLEFDHFQQPLSHMGRMYILTPFLSKAISPPSLTRINHIIEFQHPPNLSTYLYLIQHSLPR